ncbi:unnamed protein product, partial [Laminaria digitata]
MPRATSKRLHIRGSSWRLRSRLKGGSVGNEEETNAAPAANDSFSMDLGQVPQEQRELFLQQQQQEQHQE